MRSDRSGREPVARYLFVLFRGEAVRQGSRFSHASQPGPAIMMKMVRSKEFTADRAWGAVDVANMNGITTRVHWTDQPYQRHVDDGEEVFAVLDGRVHMHCPADGREQVVELGAGDVFFAGVGREHVAHPLGPARILAVESEGSV